MTVEACLGQKFESGKLNEKQYKKLVRQYNTMLRENQKLNLSEDAIRQQIEDAASQKALDAIMAKNKKIQHLRAVKRWKQHQREWMDALQAENARAGEQVEEFFYSMLNPDVVGRAGFQDVQTRIQSVSYPYIKDLVSLRDKALRYAREKGLTFDDMLAIQKNLDAATPHHPVKDFLVKIREQNNAILRRQRRGGAEVHIDEGYRPQSWRKDAMLGKKNEWIADFMRSADRARMVDRETGVPLKEEDLRGLGEFMFESITTGGRNQLQEGTFLGQGRSLARKHAKPRNIHLTDDGWEMMMKKWGNFEQDGEGFLGLMMDSVQGNARDLALIEHFGPNPKATIKHLGDVFKKKLEPYDADFGKYVEKKTDTAAAALFGEMIVQPTSKWQRGIATALSANRRLWSAIPGVQTVQDYMVRPFIKYADNVKNDFKTRDYFSALRFLRENLDKPETRELFADIGAMVEKIGQDHHDRIRWKHPETTTNAQAFKSFLAWMPDWNSRIVQKFAGGELLNNRSQSVDFAIPMIGLGRELKRGMRWVDLSQERRAIVRKHMTEDEWNSLVGMELFEHEGFAGKSYLATNGKVREHILKTTGDEAEAQAMAEKFQSLLFEYASPSVPGLSMGAQYKVGYWIGAGTKGNWWTREGLLRDSLFLMSWGLDHWFKNQRRIFQSRALRKRKKITVGAYIVGGGAISGFGYQTVLDIISGRETYMLDGDKWDDDQKTEWLVNAIIFRSGMLPIVGDALAKIAGKGLAGGEGLETGIGALIVGPARGMAWDSFVEPTAGQVWDLATQEDAEFSWGRVVDKGTDPFFLQHLFYTRLAWERIFLEGAIDLLDDDYNSEKAANADRYGRPYREGFEPGALYE